MPEHKHLWDKWRDGYYLELLHDSLNCIPTPPKPFKEMRETEFNSWLLKIDFAKQHCETDKKLKINQKMNDVQVARAQRLTLST